GCMNSTATWAASHDEPPLPMTKSRAPLSNAFARAVQHSAMRSACSVKNCSLVAMLSRHLRRILSRSSAVISDPFQRPAKPTGRSPWGKLPDTSPTGRGPWAWHFPKSDLRLQVAPVEVIRRTGALRGHHGGAQRRLRRTLLAERGAVVRL